MKDMVLDASLQAGKQISLAVAKRPTFYETTGKRVVDVFLALVLLPVIAPVLAICWVLVRLDGGPGLYSQTRVGVDGRHFKCWKLRTMIVDAEAVLKQLCESDPEISKEWHVRQKLENDPRITRVGRFLRATSLDELPQFFNILLGDMSFVGPRPFMTDQKDMYVAAGGETYFRMLPGITGHWQIYGRGTTSFVDRVSYDDDYYQAVGLREDLLLIVKTAGIVLKRTGS